MNYLRIQNSRGKESTALFEQTLEDFPRKAGLSEIKSILSTGISSSSVEGGAGSGLGLGHRNGIVVLQTKG